MKSLLTSLALCCSVAAWASDSDTSKVVLISLKTDYGTLLKSNDFVRGQNLNNEIINKFSDLSLNVGWQTRGETEWEYLHHLPSFGIGIATTRLNNSDEVGKPFSVFGFYHGTIRRWQQSAFRYNFELGLAFNWKKFDSQSNPYNIAIGSKITSRISLGLDYEWFLAKRWQLGLGANLTHFSNGAMRKPNKGLNCVAPFVRLTYLFDDCKLNNLVIIPTKKQHHEVQITIGGGIKQEENSLARNPELSSEYEHVQKYKVLTLKANYMRQYSLKGKWGGGATIYFDEWRGCHLFIDENNNAHKVKTHSSHEPVVGLFLSHELLINKVGILTDIGGNVYLPHSDIEFQNRKILFERLGVKYYFPCNMFVGVNVLANSVKASIVEWNTGYALQWGKHEVSR